MPRLFIAPSLSLLTLIFALAFQNERAVAQIQKGDLVIGIARDDLNSFRIARPALGAVPGVTENGGEIGMATPWERTFIESVEFDNANGISHNANGNLLGVNFGGGMTGFEVLNFATNGSGNFESLWSIKAQTGLTTRGAALSVSPDNTKLAWGGYDGGQIHILSYDAGSTPGTGSGATVNGWIQTADGDGAGGPGILTPLTTGITQGTTWLDNETVLAFNIGGELMRLDLTGTSFGTTSAPNTTSNWSIVKTGIFSDNPTVTNQSSTSLYYNERIAPDIIIGAAGFFASGVSTGQIFVWDKDTLDQIAKIDISGTSNAAREIALDSQGNLYIGSRGASVSVINDFVEKATAGTLTDDSSVRWFTHLNNPDDPGDFRPFFSGLDVAASVATPGDFDEDGDVDGRDFLLWQRNPGIGDLADWQAHYGVGTPLTATNTAIPEPTALTLAVVASLWLCGARRTSGLHRLDLSSIRHRM